MRTNNETVWTEVRGCEYTSDHGELPYGFCMDGRPIPTYWEDAYGRRVTIYDGDQEIGPEFFIFDETIEEMKDANTQCFENFVLDETEDPIIEMLRNLGNEAISGYISEELDRIDNEGEI